MTITQAFLLTPLVDRRVMRQERARIRKVRDHSIRAYKARLSKLKSEEH